jgi:plasmid stability protein
MGGTLATLTIRNLDDGTHARLRVRAAENGRSMEAEARALLDEYLAPGPAADDPEEYGLGSRIHARFAAIGGWDDFVQPERGKPRPVDFGE